MVQVHSPSLIGVWLNRHSNGLQNRHLEVRILPLLHILTWRRWWRIRLISGRWKVQILLSGLARSSIGRAPDSDSGCCRFESCRACCGHCIMAVPQTVDLKVRVRFPLVTPYCRRLTDKPPRTMRYRRFESSRQCDLYNSADESASLRRKRPWVQIPLQISVRIAKLDKARVL